MATYHLPEPHSSDPAVALMAQMYQDAYDATLKELRRAVAAGLTTRYRAELLRSLARRVAELRTQTHTWAYGPVDPLTGARVLQRSSLYAAVAAADRETLRQLAALGMRVEVPATGAVSASFGLLNDGAVRVVAENLVASLDRAVTQFDTTVRGIIGRAENDLFRRAGLETVGEKVAEGLTVRQGRARLVNELTERGVTAFVDARGRPWNLKSYADMVVRTTTREATGEATLRRVTAEGHDYLVATEHYPTCPVCAVRQGRVYCISGTDKRFPALSSVGNTPWHPNCFPAGVVVSGPAVELHSARWYEGDLVIIRTASGNKLPVTPNHPILTPKGWVAAGLLKEGDQVFQQIGGQWAPGGDDPDDVLVPTPIEEVPSSLWQSGGMTTVRVPVAAEHFHGDGMSSQVCIVRADRLLGDRFITAVSQPVGENLLAIAPVLPFEFSRPGPLLKLFNVTFFTANRGMSGGNLLPTALRGLSSGPNSTCLGTGWCGHDPSFAEALVNNHFGSTHESGDMAFGHTAFVQPDGLVDIYGQALTGFGEPHGANSLKADASFPKSYFQSTLADTEDVSDLLGRLSGFVQLDYVIKVDRAPFAGHVYNLQTTEGWYVANSIITHNCGHSLVPWVEKYEADLEGALSRSGSPFDVDPRDQREIDLYERSQAIKREQRRKRSLTAQMQTPGLDPDERDRLRRLRANANSRLIEYNREQRKALPGWR